MVHRRLRNPACHGLRSDFASNHQERRLTMSRSSNFQMVDVRAIGLLLLTACGSFSFFENGTIVAVRQACGLHPVVQLAFWMNRSSFCVFSGRCLSESGATPSGPPAFPALTVFRAAANSSGVEACSSS